MKKLIGLLICLALLLAACGNQPELPPETQPTTLPAQTQEQTEPATEPTVPPTEPPEPYTYFEALSWKESPYLTSLEDGTVLVETSVYYDDGGDGYNQLELLDPESGTVLASRQFTWEWAVCHSSASKELMIIDYENNSFHILDRALNDVSAMTVPDVFGAFNEDLSRYYYVSDYTLMELEMATGEARPVAGFESYRVYTIDLMRGDTLIATIRTDPFSSDTVDAALDPATGEVKIMSWLPGFARLTGSGVCYTVYDETLEVYDLYYGSFGETQLKMLPGTLFGENSGYSWIVDDTEYMYVELHEKDTYRGPALYRLGETVSYCVLEGEQFPQGFSDVCVLPDGRLLAAYFDGEQYRLLRMDPEWMEFHDITQPTLSGVPAVDVELAEGFERILNENTLPQELQEVRQRADDMEERYGVTILLSGQCEAAAAQCDFPITTTNYACLDDEAAAIDSALTSLEAALALYPEDFFAQMQSNGEGLLILLVEDIQSDNNAIGVAYPLLGWYPIALDITYWDIEGTACHEIWHAVENYITDLDYYQFNNGDWESLNPEDFFYSYDTTLDYLNYTRWTYIDGGWGTGSYFVDSYSRVNGKEDRARLMEYMMTHDDVAQDLMKAPALRKKMELISRIIRQFFDTTGPGWESVWWERYITE